MIKVENLEKSFGKLQVLQSISITIETGKITAIVGPNGSGKTTLIKCILGLVKADKGSLYVGDHLLNGEFSYRKDIGYMPQIARFPDNLSVKEVFHLVKDLRGISDIADEELITGFYLEKEFEKKVRTLSGGTKQKLSAAIAFLFAPKVLILDEPTAGLDPISSSHLKDKIIKEKADGKTIILTSHIMSEIQELADRIIFLLEGKIFFDGSVTDILGIAKESTLERAIARMMMKGNGT
jgi:Cu-processing system ATP-binding protein